METLQFSDPRRERLFRIFDERHAAPGIRLLAVLVLAIALALAAADVVGVALGRDLAVTLALRGVMVASAIGLLASTFRSAKAGKWSGRLALAAALYGTAEATLLGLAEPSYRQLHAPGMLVLIGLSCSGLRLRFPHALALAGVLDLAYLESLWVTGVTGEELGVQLALLLITTASGLVIAYQRDQGRRHHFMEVLALQAARNKLSRLTDRLRELSLSDELTGLPNRRELDTRLRASLVDAERADTPLVLAMLDLDHFKEVNDRLGHGAGDDLLRLVAAGLARSVRAGDGVFRVAGDELCLIMPRTLLAEGMQVVDRALARVRRVTERGGMTVGFSAGCAESRRGEDPAALMRRADAALNRAKAAGRGRVHGAQPTRALAAVPVAS